MGFRKRKTRVAPEQARLPLDGLEEERYDPREPEPSLKARNEGECQPTKAAQSAEGFGQLAFPETQPGKVSGSEINPVGYKKREKQILSFDNMPDDVNPFVDQFCEQVARIIARGQARNKIKKGDI